MGSDWVQVKKLRIESSRISQGYDSIRISNRIQVMQLNDFKSQVVPIFSVSFNFFTLHWQSMSFAPKSIFFNFPPIFE